MENIIIKYLGHSAFYIKAANFGILIDPFISHNPMTKFDYTQHKITHIFVTHGHGDHLGDAIEISKHASAPITAIFELANNCQQKGAPSIGLGLGGKVNFDFGSATFCPAFHSSSTDDGYYAGNASGIVLNIFGKKIFHAGDTCLTQEFKTIQELYSPEVAMLPIGGTFTMDVDAAAVAAKWLNAKYIIPIHYNTFPLIKADTDKFKTLIENNGQKCLILNGDEQIELQ